MLDQHPENAAPLRQVADPAARPRIDAAGHEPLEPGAALVQHAEGGVSRAGDCARLVEDPLEHRLEIQLSEQRSADLEQPTNAFVFLRSAHEFHDPSGVGIQRVVSLAENGMLTAVFLCP